MGGAQRRLDGRQGSGEGPAPFAVAGGEVRHPLLREGVLKARAFEVDLAAGALEGSTLVALPPGVPTTAVAALVIAGRLRQAGGFALVLASSPTKARGFAGALRQLLAEEAAARVECVTRVSARDLRREAAGRARVLVTTVEAAAADAAGGAMPFDLCSLLVVDEAHRAVAGPAYASAVRALRARRPRALVLAVTSAPRQDRRSLQAAADALGLERVETRGTSDAEVAAFGGPLAAELVEVDLPERIEVIQRLLEAEFAPRAASLARLGVLAAVPPRVVTKAAVEESGARLRRLHGRLGDAFFEAARTHAQALLLAEALEALEGRGAPGLVEFIEGLGTGRDAPLAERAVSALPGVRNAAAAARALGDDGDPLGAAALREVEGAFRIRPGAGVLVVTRDEPSARALAARAARAPPVGPGIPGLRASPGVPRAGPGDAPLDLVVMVDPLAADLRALAAGLRKSRAPRPRVVCIVAAGGRDGGGLSALTGPASPVRLVAAGGAVSFAERAPNAPLPLEVPRRPSGGPMQGGQGP